MPRGLDVVWTTRRRITVPLEHMRGARIDRTSDATVRGWAPGTDPPLRDYTVAAGPRLVRGRREFWDVHDPSGGSSWTCGRAVRAPGDRASDDPAATVEAVNAAVARSGQGAA